MDTIAESTIAALCGAQGDAIGVADI